jgi:hypothetical protein
MNPEHFGLGSETAASLSGGVFAAGAREYLRPAVGWQKRILATGLSLGGAYLFGDEVAAWAGLTLQVAAAAAGLACIGIAEGLLKAVERLDLAALFKRGGA